MEDGRRMDRGRIDNEQRLEKGWTEDKQRMDRRCQCNGDNCFKEEFVFSSLFFGTADLWGDGGSDSDYNNKSESWKIGTCFKVVTLLVAL